MSKYRFSTFSILLILLLVFSLSTRSQGDTEVAPEEMYKRYLETALSNKVPLIIKGGIIMKANWMADGNSFWYAEGAPENTVIYKVDPVANTKKPLFDINQLRKSLADKLGHEPPHKGLPFSQFLFIDGEKRVKFAVEGKEFICDLMTYEIEPVPPLSEEEKKKKKLLTPKVLKHLLGGKAKEILSPDSRWYAGVKDYNLYIRSTSDGSVTFITEDGVKGYAWDMWYAFPQWSPDSTRLAITKVDTRMMPLIPLVNWLKKDDGVEWQVYAKAGQSLWKTNLFVIDIFSKKHIKIDTGDLTDKFISIVSWLPDESELLFYRIDREFKKLDLISANPSTGSTRIILTETQKTFLNVDPFSKMELPLIEGGKKFIWMSERSGWNHLYLYDLEGKLIQRLTGGPFPVNKVLAVDEKRGWIYFTAQGDPERPYDKHLYRVSFKGKEFKRLTEVSGDRIIHVTPSKKFFLDVCASLTMPPVTELRKADGTLIRIITKANIDKLKNYLQWSPPEEFEVKAADGKTDLYGVLFKPYNFKPNKKYPVIEYIYNGPHSNDVPRSMYAVLMNPDSALTHLGFIQFVVDGRGTIGRGKTFQDVTYGKLGQIEIQDHVAVLKQLAKKRPYMDLDRVGIYGISFGGYLTLRAMLLEPDIYKIGIATSPMVDLRDVMAYTEHYMGLPKNNKKGYENGSCLNIASNLKGKLLLIHGTKDVNAPFSEVIKMAEALILAGKRFDLLILPEQPHVPYGQKAIYWYQAKHRYFQEHFLRKKGVVSLWEK